MLEVFFLYISFSVATGAVYYLFYFIEVLKENEPVIDDSSFAFKFSMFLAACFLAPKVFLGMLTHPQEKIKDGILAALLKEQKSDLE